MGPAYFVIAILGCGDASAACTPVATVATRYDSEAACVAAAPEMLVRNSDLDFANLVAECRPASPAATASNPEAEAPSQAAKA